jgi:hypothetical protein
MNVETRIALRTLLTNLGYSVVYFCGGSNWIIDVGERKIMRIMLAITAITHFNIKMNIGVASKSNHGFSFHLN